MPIETAKKYASVCQGFARRGHECRGILCDKLHIGKNDRPKASLGFYRAVQQDRTLDITLFEGGSGGDLQIIFSLAIAVFEYDLNEL